jgi:hypothetical protein
MARDCVAGHYFDFLLRLRLALNIFPFLVYTVKLIGDFYNNRRNTSHGCPCFAYSFVFLMLRQYYWRCDLCTANKQRINKIRENNLLALRMRIASPIGADSVPCFAYKCEAQRSGINMSCFVNIEPILMALRASPIFPELAYNLGSTDRKRINGKTKMKSK